MALWSPEDEQSGREYYDSQEFWREGPTSPLITNDPDKRYFAEESGGGYIPPGPPPPLDVTAPKADLTEGMPQLYKKPSADQNIPPGPRPPESGGADSVDQGDPGAYQNTERAKFIEVLKRQIGFDPMSYDPVGTAFTETKQEFLKRYGPDYLLSEGTKKMFREKMQDRMMEYVPKKQQGENAMKFALEQFDKEMGWKSANEGGGAVQPGSGKMVQLPKEDKPTEWSMRERAAKGDATAEGILAQKRGEDIEGIKAAVKARGEVTDKDMVKPLLAKLPKMMETAQASQKRVLMYENLSDMAEKGAGGLVSGLRGILAPIAEAMGMDSKIESEAQAFQLMGRAGVGKMRLELVGSGQVSNYEQDLMQKISGTSLKTSREAAKLLFKYYAKEAQQTIDDYNETIEGLKKFPEAQIYKKIGKGGGDEMVDVVNPQGIPGKIPKSKLSAALSRGYKRAN